MSRRFFVPALALAVAVAGGISCLQAARPADAPTIGIIKGPTFDHAKAESLAWLKQADASKLTAFEAVWNPAADRSVLDRVTETFVLGDAEAQKLMTTVRTGSAAVPVAAPEIFKDANRPIFFRANLALAYAKQLSSRRVHEEALEVLKTVRPEQVVDPASYYFFKAVAEHKMQLKQEGLASVNRLLESVPDAPQRYLVVAELMKAEMESWKNDDLGYIARKMDNIERRLDLARGGPKTQNEQKEVIALLDKMIEEMESKCNCSSAGAGSALRPSAPMPDSRLGGVTGPGNVANKRLLKTMDLWGKLPEKEKLKAMEQIKRDYPAHYREAIEEYLRLSAKSKSD